MKRMMIALMALLLLLPALALADGPVLLVELPEDAQMVEDVSFDDGDYIQTYQFSGVQVQLIRYGAFSMTIEELAASDWAGAKSVTPMELTEVSGYPASGVQIMHEEAAAEPVEVTLVLVSADGYTLVYSVIIPESAGDGVREQTDAMLDALQVFDPEGGSEEVG
ncbi:MAG: hypothetical protein J6K32_10905 [Clostridia bacterium]|nr:hypothetical protein [Clostridia bacterium]